MVRLLLVGKGPPDRGGIAAHLHTLLGSDLSSWHQVHFLNLTDVHAEPEGGRFTVANVARTVRDARSVWRAAAGRDVVDIHSALVPLVTAVRAGLLAAVARMRGAKVVLHAHGGELRGWLRSYARRRALRLALRAADVVVAVAEGERAALGRALGPARVQLVENGVDTAVFTPSEQRPDAPRLLYVGLLTPRKGVVDLIQASSLVRERGVAHDVVLVGGTPDEGRHAEDQVRRHAGERTVFDGDRPHDQMPEVYRRASLFCLPSWWESMPLSVLEAMASGLPVVATAVGDVPRMVDDGVTGILVPAKRPELLADALEQLLADPERSRRMGAAGRARVEAHFGLDRSLGDLDRIITDLVADGSPQTSVRAGRGST